MLHVAGLEGQDDLDPTDIGQYIIDVAWVVCSADHNILGFSPRAALFEWDMLLDIPYMADWKAIRRRHWWLVTNANTKENGKCINHIYAIGDNVLIINEGVECNAKDKHVGHFLTIHVYINSTVRIQHSHKTEHIDIRRLMPYFEWKGWHPLLAALSPYLDGSDWVCLKTWECKPVINLVFTFYVYIFSYVSKLFTYNHSYQSWWGLSFFGLIFYCFCYTESSPLVCLVVAHDIICWHHTNWTWL